MVLLVVALLATACVGERPQLVATTTTTSPSVDPTDPPPDQVVEPSRDQCTTVSGAGPFSLSVGVEAAAVECLLVAAHHRIELVNRSQADLRITSGTAILGVAAGASQLTEPVGEFLTTPGLAPVASGAGATAFLWFVAQDDHPLSTATIGLSSIGEIALGQAPAEVTAAAGVAVPASGAACHQTSLEGDPYSPIFTFQDGQLVVVQIFTPGLQTISGVAIGSSRDEVTAAYGDRVQVLAATEDQDPAQELLVFVPQDEADQIYRLVFVLESGFVRSIRFGATEIVADAPDCPS